MLLFFRVGNYKSFSQETTLNLIPTRSELFPSHVHHVGNVAAVGTAVIFGANTSGKTNLVTALKKTQEYITQGVFQDAPIPCAIPFLLDIANESLGSRFEYGLSVDGHIYSYGFVVRENEVCEEWLFETVGSKDVPIFERAVKDDKIVFEFGKELTKTYSPDKTGAAISNKTLFLTTVGQKDKTLLPIYRWFKDRLTVVSASGRFNHVNIAEQILHDKEFKNFINWLLRAFDTGIDSLVVEDLSNQIPEIITMAPAEFQLNYHKAKAKGEKANFSCYRSGLMHERNDGEKIPFHIDVESDGTRQIIKLAHFFYMAKDRERVVVIDELDRSLHSALTRGFIELFNRLASKSGLHSQLIVTTHDTNLLDSNFLRKDEVWFMSKGVNAASSLTSLAEYKTTQGLNYEKSYLAGRFGGIPDIDELSDLWNVEPESEPSKQETAQTM